MPALDALGERLEKARTLAVGVSVDSVHCHAAWGDALGGIALPLLSDFHPKGEVARSFGAYLEGEGITDRATVLVDATGVVRHASTVGPGGKRDMAELVRRCEELDAAHGGLPAFEPAPGLPEGTTLYVKDRCLFSRWALYARTNLRLQDRLPVVNCSTDASARDHLASLGGKSQAPALVHGDTVLYESRDISAFLVRCCATRW